MPPEASRAVEPVPPGPGRSVGPPGSRREAEARTPRGESRETPDRERRDPRWGLRLADQEAGRTSDGQAQRSPTCFAKYPAGWLDSEGPDAGPASPGQS